MLKARLYEHEIQKRDEQNQKNLDSKTDIGWGHQIRSYVLQPYQLVKDLRNRKESTNPSSVLDGNIDEFIVNIQLLDGTKKDGYVIESSGNTITLKFFEEIFFKNLSNFNL